MKWCFYCEKNLIDFIFHSSSDLNEYLSNPAQKKVHALLADIDVKLIDECKGNRYASNNALRPFIYRQLDLNGAELKEFKPILKQKSAE